MPVFSGNTTGSVTQVAANLPSGMMSFSLANISGGAINLNMYITNGVSNVRILPIDLSLDDGDTVYSTNPIRILKETSIHIVVTGSLDYYISIE